MPNQPSESKPHAAYDYWAFISYSSKDRAFAKWLHSALENYLVPDQFVNQPTPIGESAPKRLRPLFWDRAEMTAHHSLGELIECSLRASRYLIVVCSPNAALSPWVEKEIQSFIKIHGIERILSVIIAGQPGAKDNSNCFPPSLRVHEPKAPDARKEGDGKANAKLMLLARMLGVGFDSLKRRDQERRLKLLSFSLFGALVVLVYMGWLMAIATIARNAERAAKEQALEQTANLYVREAANFQFEGVAHSSRQSLKSVDPRHRNWMWFYLVARLGPAPVQLAPPSYDKDAPISRRDTPLFAPSNSKYHFILNCIANPLNYSQPSTLQQLDKLLSTAMLNKKEKPIFDTVPQIQITYEANQSSGNWAPDGHAVAVSEFICPRAYVQSAPASQLDFIAPFKDGASLLVSSPNGGYCIFCSMPEGLTQIPLHSVIMVEDNKVDDDHPTLSDLLERRVSERGLTKRNELVFFSPNEFAVLAGGESTEWFIRSPMRIEPLKPQYDISRALPQCFFVDEIEDDTVGVLDEVIVNAKKGLEFHSTSNEESINSLFEMIDLRTGRQFGKGAGPGLFFGAEEVFKEYDLNQLIAGDWVLGNDWFIIRRGGDARTVEIYERYKGKLLAITDLGPGVGWPEGLQRSLQRPQLSPDGRWLLIDCCIIDVASLKPVFSLPFGTSVSADWRWVVEPLGSGGVLVIDVGLWHVSNGIPLNRPRLSRDDMLMAEYKIQSERLVPLQIPSKLQIAEWYSQRQFTDWRKEKPRRKEKVNTSGLVAYRIGAGETIQSVANYFKATIEEIRRLNRLASDAELKEGDEILINTFNFEVRQLDVNNRPRLG
ncbi:MAG TPA: TIR domain-containing protein, partial [Fimbriimonas sp.]|nr:TIR domain-containing protein [Fimbriimonas sp.]